MAARRNRKAVDYSQFGGSDDDDEDFASVRSSKKPKGVHHSELKKEKRKVPKQEIVSQKKSPLKRVTLDDKLYQRHLEVALALSVNEPPISTREACGGTVADFRQGSATASQKLQTEDKNGDSADGCEPEAASSEESENDSSFSKDDCDEFVVKKKMKQNKKEEGKLNVENRRCATKPSKQKTNCMVKSQPVLLKASCSTEPVGKPLKTSSPLAAKKPTWIPPAASGNRASQQERVPVTSPTQGLRLGLSRLARVKPLHPSFAGT